MLSETMSTPTRTASAPEVGPPRRAVGSLELVTPDGAPVRLDDFAGPTLVVQFVRYFGCLPCQVYLRQLDGRAAELAAVGAHAIAVGGSAVTRHAGCGMAASRCRSCWTRRGSSARGPGSGT